MQTTQILPQTNQPHNTAAYDRWAARLLVALALGGFILSYAGMYALAIDSGFGWLSILWPLVTETAVVIFSLVYLVAKLKGYHNRTLMPLIVGCTILSVIFNIAHAPVGDYLGRAAWALPPLILFAAFKTYVWLIEQDMNRAGYISTLAELAAKIGSDRQAAETLTSQIETLTGKRDALNLELGSFSELGEVNAAIEAAKENGGIWYSLSKFMDKNILKTDLGNWAELRHLIWLRDGKQCKVCKTDLEKITYHCHHILPESSGGPGDPTNLITLCEGCHAKAHRKPLFSDESVSLSKARTAKQQKIKERQAVVLEKSRAGWSVLEIAEHVGFTVETVKSDLKKLGIDVGPSQKLGKHFSDVTIRTAREVFANNPTISGAEMGRRVGISPRKGLDLLKLVKAEVGPIELNGHYTNGVG